MANQLFNDANEIIESIRLGFTFEAPERPTIKIRRANYLDASGMVGRIEITEGYIDYCLNLPSMPLLSTLIETNENDPPLPLLVPNPLFAWTIAHEYWHGLRRHNLALEQLPLSNEYLKAMEIDADLCAAASVFRWAQKGLASAYTDLTIRQIVFACLHWAIRHLPKHSAQPSDTHPSWMERLFHVKTKLIQLSSQPGKKVDPSEFTDESKNYVLPLLKVAKKTEEAFRINNPGDTLDFIGFLIGFIENKRWQTFTTPWDEMRLLVKLGSGTDA